MIILNSTLRRDANVGTAQSANYRLKWPLRCASGIFIPAQDGPDTEVKKEEALKEGIQKIEEFGAAKGRWAGQKGQDPDDIFLATFGKLLRDNEIPK